MPVHAVTHALPLAAIIACLLWPAPASSAGQCPGKAKSCNGGSGHQAERRADPVETGEGAKAATPFPIVDVSMDEVEEFERRVGLNQFNCQTYPELCKAPFNCDRVAINKPEATAWVFGKGAKGLAASGRPNFKAWCTLPTHGRYIHTCLVERDLGKAAREQYEGSKAGKFAPDAYELDGSYCFIEGHCLNTRVRHNTTLKEAVRMCDERFGRERWTSFGSSSSQDVLGVPEPRNRSNGYDGWRNTAPFLVASCAMGNYHCDVMYCKETYCKDEYMVKKYGYFLEKFGWTNSTASWMHPVPLQGQKAPRGQ